MLTLRDLELVRFVAETGSLTAAAERLHVTQSAASQRLAGLHRRLDLPLVERHNGRMRLTPAGERIVRAARTIGGELRDALADLERLRKHAAGILRIATQCYTCYRWLPFVIAAMRRDYPSLTVDVVPEATEAPYEALRSRRVEVALISNPDPASNLVAHELFSDELFAVMHDGHRLAGRPYLAPGDFSGETLVLYTGKRHAIVEEVLAPAGVTDFAITQVRMTEAVVELARSGHGIAVIAGWALDDIGDGSGLAAVRITRDGFVRTWRAVVGEHCDANYARSLAEHLRAAGDDINSRGWRGKLRRRLRP